jgi:hypothetical protein
VFRCRGRGTAIAHRVAALSDRVAAGSFNVGGVGDGGWSDKRILPDSGGPDTYEKEEGRVTCITKRLIGERGILLCLEWKGL